MKKGIVLIISFIFCVFTYAERLIKVLAIGNSFSQDAVENYLWDLGKAADISFIIGNASIGGCSLSTHWNNASGNLPKYSFRKIVDGQKTIMSNQTLEYCIKNEDWDYITFQQVSTKSGIPDSYFPYFPDLIEYVKGKVTNPDVKYAMHQTWAYPQATTKAEFKLNYNEDQMTMFNAIVTTVWNVAKKVGIEMIIPAGTAIQNGRSSHVNDIIANGNTVNDNFNRDGSHLSHTLGRFTVSCVWYEALTGNSVLENKYELSNLSLFQVKIAKKAAHFATQAPKSVTNMQLYKDVNSFSCIP